uniref:Uncharacterized protein n=1 Tax=Arundo donax TaxID=35708 RepID=A0A0A9FL84_ARUDO
MTISNVSLSMSPFFTASNTCLYSILCRKVPDSIISISFWYTLRCAGNTSLASHVHLFIMCTFGISKASR